jgi:hypothetical protein
VQYQSHDRGLVSEHDQLAATIRATNNDLKEAKRYVFSSTDKLVTLM